jgi:hypothetical protein
MRWVDQGVLWTSTNRTTTQAAAMVKVRGATKFFMVDFFRDGDWRVHTRSGHVAAGIRASVVAARTTGLKPTDGHTVVSRDAGWLTSAVRSADERPGHD